VSAYDPKAALPKELSMVEQSVTPDEAIRDADLIVVVTDWKQIIDLDWKLVRRNMKGRAVIDARNCLNPALLREADLDYIGVGRL
jgi:UDPglucose 6-dehydrogenase